MVVREELLLRIMDDVFIGSESDVLDGVIRIWRTLEQRFTPLLGPASVAVLFMRSLDTARRAFPWLPPIHVANGGDISFSVFEAALRCQPASAVLPATRAMLAAYIDSLFALIGITLTTQFVNSAFRGDAK